MWLLRDVGMFITYLQLTDGLELKLRNACAVTWISRLEEIKSL